MAIIGILSHEKVAAELSILGEWAKERGHKIKRFYREENWNEAELLESDLVIVFGSPNSVSTGFIHPTAEKEIQMVKSRLDADQPFFGICYGAQVMARALGGEVERRNEKNIGYKQISTNQNFDNGGWVLWHEDFISPASLENKEGIEILGTDAGAVIAFKNKRATAVQFHLEPWQKPTAVRAHRLVITASRTASSTVRWQYHNEQQLTLTFLSLLQHLVHLGLIVILVTQVQLVYGISCK